MTHDVKICMKCGQVKLIECKCDPSVSLMQKILEDCNKK